MQRIQLTVVLTVTVTATAACGPGTPSNLATFADSSSYAIGLDIGSTLSRMDASAIDLDLLARGIRDEVQDNERLLEPQNVRLVLMEFSRRMQEQMAQERASLIETNAAEGEAFLAENRTKEGVITQPSGLQYVVLEEGTGASPEPDDVVTVHYRGTLLDGTEFDSSYERGEPASFQVGGVISGWTEGLQLMKVGGKYRLWVPSHLGYGEQGSGDQIGPNATLVFEVELLEIGQ